MKMIVDARQQYFPEFAELASQIDHDLRSPLTAICSYAECLTFVTGADPAVREKYARVIMAEARRLGRMASNFLLLSALQPEGELEQVALHEVLTEALEELGDLLELQETTVALPAPAETAVMTWHRPALHHLLVATVECALESAGRDAALTVDFSSQAREVTVVIGTTSAHAHAPDARSFAFRAAARLVGTRGGSLLSGGDQPQLRLLIPYAGALYPIPDTAPALRKSA